MKYTADKLAEACYQHREATAAERWPSGYRLGPSSFVSTCHRRLWYSFRWATKKIPDGRMQALFETGNLAEPRLTKDISSIPGVTVYAHDEETGKQFEVLALGGHFRGFMDGIAEGLEVEGAPPGKFVLEYKTHSYKSFEWLLSRGSVREGKVEHYNQIQLYLHLNTLGIKQALYVAKNKNDEALYFEVVLYNQPYAEQLLSVGESVVYSTEPPPRISPTSKGKECRFCDHVAVCSGEAFAYPSCRTCVSSYTKPDGGWGCHTGFDIPSHRETTYKEAPCSLDYWCPQEGMGPGKIVAFSEEWGVEEGVFVDYETLYGEKYRIGSNSDQYTDRLNAWHIMESLEAGRKTDADFFNDIVAELERS
jgi:CRISPR/Cas system-associated exonuclease Cas4 (RecB family)